MKVLLLALIRFYREKISPVCSPRCRFIPTCSAYALEAVEVHGAVKGTALALWRLLRCHPFHRQKGFLYDPVPPKKVRYPTKKPPAEQAVRSDAREDRES